MITLTEYRSAPKTGWMKASHDDLLIIADEILAAESTATTEWARDAWECDNDCIALALKASERGEIVLVARDEDGFYFAKESNA